MGSSKNYIREDEHGVMRVGGTRVAFESIIYPFREGRSPESIRQSFPALTLEDVYGAITYYLANRPLADDYLKRQDDELARQRASQDSNPSDLVRRLRAVKAERSRNNA
jgi:uncharacterized protein (DUF433 family)